ncbi:MAG TPA: transposase [Candidatus Paceibacterota bacterium]|nr:transposase [Candidatus Paceibacterota bacterium]
MSRGLTFQQGGFYHVYNRGTEKREIFISESDYERFVNLLYLANSAKAIHFQDYRGLASMELLGLERGNPLVTICAYCLMPNHFHLLLQEHTPGGLSQFIHKLTTSYTMYFNTKYDRSGALFEGTFKARDANEDRYLKYLISYIHLNPVKLIEPHWKESGIQNIRRAKAFLNNYPYSSFADYSGVDRIEKVIITMDALPDYFADQKDFRTHIFDGLQNGEFIEA